MQNDRHNNIRDTDIKDQEMRDSNVTDRNMQQHQGQRGTATMQRSKTERGEITDDESMRSDLGAGE